MKKITFLSFLLLVTAMCTVSCSKQENMTNPQDKQVEEAIAAPRSDNQEQNRIRELLDFADYQVGIFADANWGMTDEYSFKINGVFPPNFNVALNYQMLQQSQDYNDILDRNPNHSNMLGQTISIQAGPASEPLNSYESQSLYLPKPIVAERLIGQDPNTIYLERNSSNVLRWTPDPNNQAGIAIMYETYDTENHWQGNQITSDIIVMDDTGSFDLQALISDPAVKAINLTLIRTNLVGFQTPEQESVVVGAKVSDHHLYMIQ
ncbi:MAG: hypothetical protein AAFV25_27675 [Bacteroidota bacterium]